MKMKVIVPESTINLSDGRKIVFGGISVPVLSEGEAALMDWYHLIRKQDLDAVQRLLPSHYVCELRPDGIYCRSGIGVRRDWDSIFDSIKTHFGDRFQEVYAHICTYHKSFTVYYKPYGSSTSEVPDLNKA